MVRIFADSTCDLSKELIQQYNITVIPLYIILSDKEYRDGIEIMPDDIYKWSTERNLSPKTAAASIIDVVEAVEPVIKEGEEIIMFSISGKMSAMGNIFTMVTQELGAEDKVTVIDSGNLSTGIGHLVLEAAVMAARGYDRKAIAERIDGMKPCVRSSFVVDTLDYLHRGGRCSGVAAMAGGVLKIHPKILVENGEMKAGRKYRGRINTVIMDYVRDMQSDLLKAKKDRVFITHSGCDDDIIESVYRFIDEMNRFEEILITRAGGVISSHCGPGTLGVLYVME